MAEPKHIVVMNDDATILDVLESLLTDEGYRVTRIRESRKAYDLIKELQPDLVLLDIRMGNDLTGFEVIGLLVLDPATRRIPLIVASAASDALSQHAAQLAEQNIPVLAKPFDLDDLLRLIAEVLAPGASGDRPA